jgi:alginate O-acetyltransferase complex protein AlgI
MVFSSHLFLFYFLPLALAVYYLLPRRGKHLALTLLSFAFYGWANPLFVVLLLGSTLVDYYAALVMTGAMGSRGPIPALTPGTPRSRRQRTALVVSIVSNLALLGFFKYFNFATDSLNAIGQSVGLPGLRLDLAFEVTLPLGISFYTFQSMSYTIDVYRGNAAPKRNFIDFACFVSMFPQLVAGPIIRYSEVSRQLEQRTYSVEKFARGVAFLSLGLAKKILLANPCGKVADVAFDAGSVGFIDSWIGAIAYAFHIYFDFSAYSDMAIGLGLMLGFVFPKNFNSPYLAESITDFWRRWHISLSTWLRDYLYIPLGGNRSGAVRTYVNLAMVMVIGGLWHGASWNFVVWGAMHGALLISERWLGGKPFYASAPRPLRIGITFVLVLFTWVFFRAADLPSALRYMASMFGLAEAAPAAALLPGIYLQPFYLLALPIAMFVVWTRPQVWDWTRHISIPKAAAIAALLWLSLVILNTQDYNPFIYFIF